VSKESFVLSDYERGFLEAGIDFEGCIGLYKHIRKCGKGFSWEAMVTIDNTNRDILEKVKLICHGKGCISTTHNVYGAVYHYRIPVMILRDILPQLSLVIKERKRQLLLTALCYLRQGSHDNHDEYLELISNDIKEADSK